MNTINNTDTIIDTSDDGEWSEGAAMPPVSREPVKYPCGHVKKFAFATNCLECDEDDY